MKKGSKAKITSRVIIINLVIGNTTPYIGGKSSFGTMVNYPLMVGMSVACIVLYILFFNFLHFENYTKSKLFVASILSCMMIVFLGNSFALFIKEPIMELFYNFGATVIMGIMGNVVLFPFSLILGLMNFLVINYLNETK